MRAGTLLRGVLTPIISIALVFLLWDLIIRGFAVETFVAPSPGETLDALREN
jgi:ABC-type nitrate/sulfonate/bicarbonate transport system permease component